MIGILCRNKFSVVTKILRLKNSQVTGQFIAFFIGKKLRLGYPLKPLIKALSKEFSRFKKNPSKRGTSLSLNSVKGLMITSKQKFLGFYKLVKGVYKNKIYIDYLKNDTW